MSLRGRKGVHTRTLQCMAGMERWVGEGVWGTGAVSKSGEGGY